MWRTTRWIGTTIRRRAATNSNIAVATENTAESASTRSPYSIIATRIWLVFKVISINCPPPCTGAPITRITRSSPSNNSIMASRIRPRGAASRRS